MEPTDPGTPATCWNCKRAIERQGSTVSWYYTHPGIIVMTLFGLGPFSLGLVWKSPVISREAKIAYTVLILGFTWFVGLSIYKAYQGINALLTGGLGVYGLQ